MHTRTTLPLLTILVATGTTGCYTTWDINPRTLAQLNGFRMTKSVPLQVSEDTSMNFDEETEVHFRGMDGMEADAKFSSIDIEGSVLIGTRNPDGEQLNVDLSRMSETKITALSGTRTGLLVGGVVGGAVLAGLGFLIFAGMGAGAGRPLRLAGQPDVVRAHLLVNKNPRRSQNKSINDRTRQTMFQHWAKETSSECASIPAFLALARDLKRLGAPRGLVDAALQAARDEARHTQLCAALANQYGDVSMTAITPPTPEAADINAHALLERLVLEAFWDGCVAEGTAAAIARRNAEVSHEETTRLALRTIAHDEQDHAELAQQVLAFGLSASGRSVRNALQANFEQKRATEEAALERSAKDVHAVEWDEDFTRRHGLPSRAISHAGRMEAWERSIALLAAI